MKAVIYRSVGNPDQPEDWLPGKTLRWPSRDMGGDNADSGTCTDDVADREPTV